MALIAISLAALSLAVLVGGLVWAFRSLDEHIRVVVLDYWYEDGARKGYRP